MRPTPSVFQHIRVVRGVCAVQGEVQALYLQDSSSGVTLASSNSESHRISQPCPASSDVEHQATQKTPQSPTKILDPEINVDDSNGKRVSKRVVQKVRPGEMSGCNNHCFQVWNEDVEEPSAEQ